MGNDVEAKRVTRAKVLRTDEAKKVRAVATGKIFMLSGYRCPVSGVTGFVGYELGAPRPSSGQHMLLASWQVDSWFEELEFVG